MLLSCSDIICVHDLEMEKPILFTDNQTRLTAAAYNHNSKIIVSGSEDGHINFLSSSALNNLSEISEEETMGSVVTSLTFNSDSRYLAYSTENGYLKIWSLKNSKIYMDYKLEENFITSLAFNQLDTTLMAGTTRGDILSYNLVTNAQSNLKFQSFSKINKIKYSPFLQNILGVAYDDGSMKLIDTETSQTYVNYKDYHNQQSVSDFAFSPINKLLLCSAGVDNRVNFFDTSQKTHIKYIKTGGVLKSLIFCDGSTIALGCDNGTILIYDLRNCVEPKRILLGNKGEVNHLDYSTKKINRSLSSSEMKHVDLKESNKERNEREATLTDRSMKSEKQDENKGSLYNKKNIPNKKTPLNDNTNIINESNISNTSNKLNENLELKNSLNQKYNPGHKPTLSKESKEFESKKYNNFDNNVEMKSNISIEKNEFTGSKYQNNTFQQSTNIVSNLQNNIPNNIPYNMTNNMTNNLPNNNEFVNSLSSNNKFTNKIENNKFDNSKFDNSKFDNSKYDNNKLDNSKFNNNYALNNNYTLNNNDKYDKYNLGNNNNKITTESLNNKVTNIELKSSEFIKSLIETEFSKVKTHIQHCIHEEVQSLHVDLIRQFEIQQIELINKLKHFTMVNGNVAKEIEKLRKENDSLKSKFF